MKWPFALLISFTLIGPSSAALARHIFRNFAYIDYCSFVLRASWHSSLVKLCSPASTQISFLMKDYLTYIVALEGITSWVVRGNYFISQLNLLLLHPDGFAALSDSSWFAAIFVSPYFPVLYFFHQNERLGQGCSGYLNLLHSVVVRVRAEESSLLSAFDLWQ